MFEALIVLAIAFWIGGFFLRIFFKVAGAIIRIMFGLGGLLFMLFIFMCLFS